MATRKKSLFSRDDDDRDAMRAEFEAASLVGRAVKVLEKTNPGNAAGLQRASLRYLHPATRDPDAMDEYASIQGGATDRDREAARRDERERTGENG